MYIYTYIYIYVYYVYVCGLFWLRGRERRGWRRGGGGGGEGVDGASMERIFWSNTSHHLATSSEASTSGCHGSAESDLKVSTKS